jgi:hypothetical protein
MEYPWPAIRERICTYQFPAKLNELYARSREEASASYENTR